MKKKEKILITSAGSLSANYLIEKLKENNIIIAIDIYDIELLTIDHKNISKFYKVPQTVDEEKFLESIVKIVKVEKISFILPLTDIDVDFFSKYRLLFRNQCVAISNVKSIKYARDKFKFYQKFLNEDVNLIKTYLKREIKEGAMIYPSIAKPRNGRSSVDNFIINNLNDLNYSLITENHIVQPYIDGEIIAIDVVSDSSYNFVYCARKELIRSKNGYGITVQYVHQSEKLYDIIRKIIKITSLQGLFNIELIYADEKYFLMDINPRPSAGLVFSHIFGYNFAAIIIDIYFKDKLDTNFKYSGIEIIKRSYHELY